MAAALLLLPSVAQADWRRAESDHFLVYTNGSERVLREYTVKLERFDALMRMVSGRPAKVDGRKLPIYLVDNARELRIAQPGLPEGVAGFYSASDRAILAVLVRGGSDDVLLHEYAHHFMFDNFPGGYPGWFTEGFAEYFMTATMSGSGRATIGMPNPGRMYQLNNQRWIPMDRVLRSRPRDLEQRDQRGAFYAQSWLLTHYMLADADRIRRLDGYMRDVTRGGDPIEALAAHFGMTPETLERALKTYLNGRLRYGEMDTPGLDPQLAIARLPESMDDLMLLNLDVVTGAPDDKGAGLLAQVRTAAAKHPGDPFALTVLGRAEMEWGDPAAGETALHQALTADPTNVDALLLLAERRIRFVNDTPDREARLKLYGDARRYLARGYQADPTDYRVLRLLARTRREASDYPTANDLDTWRAAVSQAPQVLSLRSEAADVMIDAGHREEAALLLTSVANDPHGGANAERARERLEQLRAGPAPEAGAPAAE